MRVVLDTNVLLAALISSHSPPDIIYRAWLARRFDLVTGKAQLDELRRLGLYDDPVARARYAAPPDCGKMGAGAVGATHRARVAADPRVIRVRPVEGHARGPLSNEVERAGLRHAVKG